MGLATLFHPRTRNWRKARTAMTEYVAEREAADRAALGIKAQGAER